MGTGKGKGKDKGKTTSANGKWERGKRMGEELGGGGDTAILVKMYYLLNL
jgi:hypothetical protein